MDSLCDLGVDLLDARNRAIGELEVPLSLVAEGGEPSVETLGALERLARGEIDEDTLLEQLRRRYTE